MLRIRGGCRGNREALFGELYAISQTFDLLEVIFDLESRRLHFVKIWLSGFPIIADSRAQPVVQVILQRVDPIGLLLLESRAIRLNHLDQVHA